MELAVNNQCYIHLYFQLCRLTYRVRKTNFKTYMYVPHVCTETSFLVHVTSIGIASDTVAITLSTRNVLIHVNGHRSLN